MFTEPTNEDRAGWAMVAVDAFAEKTGLDTSGDDLETKVGDLIANLMHLCRLNQIEFAQVLESGRKLFAAELTEEGPQSILTGIVTFIDEHDEWWADQIAVLCMPGADNQLATWLSFARAVDSTDTATDALRQFVWFVDSNVLEWLNDDEVDTESFLLAAAREQIALRTEKTLGSPTTTID